MKQHKGKIIATAVILCVLVVTYFWGGNYAGKNAADKADTHEYTVTQNIPENVQTDLSQGVSKQSAVDKVPTEQTNKELSNIPNTTAQPDTTVQNSVSPQPEQRDNSSNGVYNGSESQGMTINPDTGKDKYLTDPVPEGKTVPVEPQDVVIKNTAYTCILSVRCDTILNNMELLAKEKRELVPPDGIIFPATEVTFYEGESVFNVLQREMKKNKIHLEFRNTPMYNSAYIEGINNLYEFDVGELSGWMYKVNGWFPNYGCSRYQLKPGDAVEWVYTCDLGRDVGGYYAAGDER